VDSLDLVTGFQVRIERRVLQLTLDDQLHIFLGAVATRHLFVTWDSASRDHSTQIEPSQNLLARAVEFSRDPAAPMRRMDGDIGTVQGVPTRIVSGEGTPSGNLIIGVPGRLLVELDNESGRVTNDLIASQSDQETLGKRFELKFEESLVAEVRNGKTGVSQPLTLLDRRKFFG
jgi:hypothetical protein